MKSSEKIIQQLSTSYKYEIVFEKLKETIEILTDQDLVLPRNEEEFQSFSKELSQLAYSQLKQKNKIAALSLVLVNFNKGDFRFPTTQEEKPLNQELYNLEQGLLTLGKTLSKKTFHISKIEEIFRSIDMAFCTYEILNRKVSSYNPAFSSFFDFEDTYLKSFPAHIIFEINLKNKIDDFYKSNEESKTFIYDFINTTLKKGVVHLTKLKTLKNSDSTISIFITDISDKIENAYLTKENTIKTKQLAQKEELITQMINELVPDFENLTHLLQEEKWKDAITYDIKNEIQLITQKFIKNKNYLQNINLFLNTEDNQVLDLLDVEKTIYNIVNQLSKKALFKNVFLDVKTNHLHKKVYELDSTYLLSILNNLVLYAIDKSNANNSIVIESSSKEISSKKQQLTFNISFHSQLTNEIALSENIDVNILTISKLLLKIGSELKIKSKESHYNTYSFSLNLEEK